MAQLKAHSESWGEYRRAPCKVYYLPYNSKLEILSRNERKDNRVVSLNKRDARSSPERGKILFVTALLRRKDPFLTSAEVCGGDLVLGEEEGVSGCRWGVPEKILRKGGGLRSEASKEETSVYRTKLRTRPERTPIRTHNGEGALFVLETSARGKVDSLWRERDSGLSTSRSRKGEGNSGSSGRGNHGFFSD